MQTSSTLRPWLSTAGRAVLIARRLIRTTSRPRPISRSRTQPEPTPSPPRPTYTTKKPLAPTPSPISSIPVSASPPSKSIANKSQDRSYLNFGLNSISRYWDTVPPTSTQLAKASVFFQAESPKFLWSAPKFATMNFGDSPEVCFLGRSNVGKSSLLNAILGKKGMAHVSSKPGRTKMMNAFAVGGDLGGGSEGGDDSKRLVVLDMPGYGKGGRGEWGKEILKYLSQRKQMKRAFLLIDAEHGLKSSDEQLLTLFRKNDIPHQVLLSKVDKVLFDGSRIPSQGALQARFDKVDESMRHIKSLISADVEDEGSGLGEVIACSSERSSVIGGMMGIDAVRFSMLRAAGLEFEQTAARVKPQVIVSYEELEAMQTGPTGRAASAAPVEQEISRQNATKTWKPVEVVPWDSL